MSTIEQRETARDLVLSERFAVALLFVAPAMFSTNMLTARATADLIPPVALAFWRWAATLVLLLPFTAGALWRGRAAFRGEWLDYLVLGALGMGVCGAFVYIGAATSTATNIGLIYASSPVMIILLGHFAYGEAMSKLQALGVALSLAGVLTIIVRADLAVLLGLRFTAGDLWILAASIGWALYSVWLRHRPSALALMPRFAAIVAGGVVTLAPFLALETAASGPAALNAVTIGTVVLLAVVPSFGAYQVYALLQRTLGANRTGLMMYLSPIYNAALASVLLGERLEFYHLLGALLVLPGLYLATHRPRAP